MTKKALIARRVACEFNDGAVVNLGIGLPTLVANYLPHNRQIFLQSENGFIGVGPLKTPQKNLTNASGQPCGMIPGAAMFDSALSFALIRGGHIDACVLGGLEVDQEGNLANWMVPNKMVPGMGGAMDLVTGAKKVIIAMEHCTKTGAAKILKKCQLPLTAQNCVDVIITELAVFRFINGQLTLEEHGPEITLATIRAKTPADFVVANNYKAMTLN